MAGRRLLEASLYLAFLVLVAEGGARVFLSVETLRRRVEGLDDASLRLRFTHRREGSPSLEYSFDDPHPVRGWALRPNLRDLPVFRGQRLSSNARGVRGTEEHARPKPTGLRRILVFGDSFTFGEGVADAETYCARLQERLAGAEVVNLGVHGYGHDQMLLYLKEVGASYEPDVVLLGVVYDDLERNLLSFRDFAKPRFEIARDRLVLTGVPVPTPEAVQAQEPWRSKFLDLFTMLGARLEAGTERRRRRRDELATRLFDEFRVTALALGARPFLVYLPVWRELEASDPAPSEGERFFADYCRERRAPHLSLRPLFLDQARRGVPLKSRGHWDASEHALAAAGIRDALLEAGLLPAP